MSLINVSIVTSSTLENFFALPPFALFASSPKISAAPSILLAESLLLNKISFTVMSSSLAYLLGSESR